MAGAEPLAREADNGDGARRPKNFRD
jgi:hypothetical protein